MIYANGVHHSLAAYGARREVAGNDWIILYDPSDSHKDEFVNVDSRDTVSLHLGNAKIDSFILFNY
ncbi:MAG: hypothetical protein LBS28_03250 [Streptococcaceae bacterium]|jgi:hypothetical protein|nr:hypothetical protein [Streptococcaceae bacterium]